VAELGADADSFMLRLHAALAEKARRQRCPLSNWLLMKNWYGWVGLNHRPPDPQSGALTN
jgi:hypothetical protein